MSSDTDSIQEEEEVQRGVPRYISKKSGKKEKENKAPKKVKKSKFLVDEDDVDVSSLDRSAAGESTASDVIENFVLPSSISDA